MRHLLLIGRAGIGKTTLLKRLIQELRRSLVDGFLIEELREAEQRVGYWLSPLDGRQVLLAHRRMARGARVGPYRVNAGVLKDVAIPVLQRARQHARLVFLDELGRMTLCSRPFVAAVQELLERGPRVVATAGVAPLPFLTALKQRRDVELIPLTASNRGGVEEELAVRLAAGCTEDEAIGALERQADGICELIVSGDAAPIDIEIQQAALREAMARACPERLALYPLLYESRFRRLWQQFRRPDAGLDEADPGSPTTEG